MKIMFEIQDIFNAYKKLKSYVYYDNTSLFLREQIADFEDGIMVSDRNNIEEFKQKLNNRFELLLSFLNNNDKEILQFGSINCKIIPKTMVKNKPTKNFLTNKIDLNKSVTIDSFNYLINAPIEIHIISILWLMYVGKDLIKYVDKYNYAYRLILNPEENKSQNDIAHGLQLFEPYFIGYQNWRDNALTKALALLDENKSATILSLDIKRYYYTLKINLEEFLNQLDKGVLNNSKSLYLTKLLDVIHRNYYLAIKGNSFDKIKETHLPVGLLSSGFIGNLYLNEFDKCVIDKLNPSYYGRYVDDILFVFSDRMIDFDDHENIIDSFMNKMFVDNGILNSSQNTTNDNEYTIIKNSELTIQNSKIILEHFLPHESRAAINKFKHNINKQRSEFRFLPDEDIITEEFDYEAFNLRYSDSINKLRSVDECIVDKYGASRFLANKIYLSSLVPKRHLSHKELEAYNRSAKQILSYFRNKICVSLFSLWEKVATYFIINEDIHNLELFQNQVKNAIEKIELDENKIINEKIISKDKIDLQTVKNHLLQYFKISMAMPLSMNLNFDKDIVDFSELALKLRFSNLFRHTLLPLNAVNYTNLLFDTRVNLFAHSSIVDHDLSISQNVFHYLSPRFVHYYEFQLINFHNKKSDYNQDNDLFWEMFIIVNYKWQELFSKKDLNDYGDNYFFKKVSSVDIYNKNFDYYAVNDPTDDSIDGNINKTILNTPNKKVAIANMEVLPSNFIASLDTLQNANLTRKRRKKLFDIINTAVKEKCDMIVLPELSVPFQWLDFLAYQCRSKNIAIIVGLEYFVDHNNDAYNYSAVILPVEKYGYRTCFIDLRNKKFYSPAEQELVRGYRYNIPISNSSIIPHIYHWKNVYFSVFNCFELANICDRSVLKSKVDFLVSIEHNKDIIYFSDVIGSCVRDLHCYIIQVNASQYGDSRIMQPTSRIYRDMIIVKGGKNDVALVEVLDVKSLRLFQNQEYNLQLQDKRFKSTPPAYDKDILYKRANNMSLINEVTV